MNITGFLKKIPLAFHAKTLILFIKKFGIGKEQRKILSKLLTASLFPEKSDRVHLDAAMGWLTKAQDVNSDDKGVSRIFSFQNGWEVSYPETSGYIIATYFAYGELTGDSQYLKRAVEIGDWEIAIQAPNGGVYSNPTVGDIRVFNTGQVMLGWCLLHEEIGGSEYLNALVRAGNYLIEIQNEDGSWSKDTYSGAKTYDARVDWALLKVYEITGNTDYKKAAINNIRWILGQQKENGWFDNCGFYDDLPITHVIIYTLRGLLECELLSPESLVELNLMEAVIKSVDKLCIATNTQFVHGVKGMIPSAFDENWNGVIEDSCLTGNVQFVCLLYRLSHIINDNELYLKTADLILSSAKKSQIVDTSIEEIKGALAGSFPIYRGYVRDAYPNWATKFLADALMMKIGYKNKEVIKA
jgi:hypothetical protein